MAAYNYKYVSAVIPEFIKEAIEDYEGSCDYDGDMWIAASNYIDELEKELSYQYNKTKNFQNEKLLHWLKNRTKTSYNSGPIIVE